MKSKNFRIVLTSVLTVLILSALTICFIVINKKNVTKETHSPSDAIASSSDILAENEILDEEGITGSITGLSTELVSQAPTTPSEAEATTNEEAQNNEDSNEGSNGDSNEDSNEDSNGDSNEGSNGDSNEGSNGDSNEDSNEDSNGDSNEGSNEDTNEDTAEAGKFIPEDLINTGIVKNYVKPAHGPASITTPDGAPVDIVAANPVGGGLNPSVVTTSPAACGTVGGDYFNDAVFIGNSRTEGLMIYTGVSGINLAYTGLNVKTAYTTNAIRVNGTKVPVMTALHSTTFSKAYVMFGVNEVGWMSADTFISYYRNIIQDIKSVNPAAIIYIQSMLPVTAAFEASRGYITNAKIYEFNTYLKGLADEQGVYFLNIAEVIADETGYLPTSASSDGYHLNSTYCNMWYDYLKTHAVQ